MILMRSYLKLRPVVIILHSTVLFHLAALETQFLLTIIMFE